MNQSNRPAPEVQDATTMGMFAMMAMMLVCCVGILLLFLLIPVLGWPIGLAVVVVVGAALMYVHHRLMGGHGH